MGLILSLGDLQKHESAIHLFRGWSVIRCHSVEGFMDSLGRHRPMAVVVATECWTLTLESWMKQVDLIRPGLRWVLLLREGVSPMVSSRNRLFLESDLRGETSRQFRRWLLNGDPRCRRVHRQECRGGVRLTRSDYSRQQGVLRAFGRMTEVSPQGARLRFHQEIQGLEGDFFEVTLKDVSGQLRSYHAQVRWQKRTPEGGMDLGVQLLARASG